MTPTREVQERLRRYLLGQLVDETREEIERNLLADGEVFEELLVIEDEIIDDYLRGELRENERAAFESHFLATPERHDQLRFGQAFQNYLAQRKLRSVSQQVKRDIPKVSWSRFFFSSPWRTAVFAIVLVVIALGSWQLFFRQSPVDQGLVALNSAYREQRPTQARISNLNYAPFVVTRGSESEKIDQNELRRAELILLDALKNKPTPAAYHALGKLYLAKKDFDTAIENFDKALRTDPKDAQLYSDLGAAWLEKGKRDRTKEPGKSIEDFGRSLENLTLALERNSNLPEALFNRALVHQELGLPEQARDDWSNYLERDSTSKWADEARQQLRYHEQKKDSPRTKEELLHDFLTAYEAHDDAAAWRIVSVSRDALSRKLIWEQLLDRHLAISSDETDAKRSLQALVYEGDLEYRRAGDRYVSDLARFYQHSPESQKRRLAQARILIQQGHDQVLRRELDKAADTYHSAQKLFAQLGDRCESQYAQHWIGQSYYEIGKTAEGLAILEDLAQTLEKENYQWLLMRTLRIASSSYHNLDEYSKAISYNRRALSLAERINDLVGIFDVSSVLIFQYGSTGNHIQALEYIRPALSAFNDCPVNEIQSARYYSIVALAFYDSGLYYAAIDFEKEALKRAIESNLAQNVSVRYARLGVMYGKVGEFVEASRNLDLAYQAAKFCPDEAIRKELIGFSSLEAGHLYREQGQFVKAISSYDQTIAVTDNIRFQYDAYEAHKNRLFCYISLGDDRSATEELKTTLSLAEKYRSKIVEGDNRNGFFDIQQSVYDLAIDFSYTRQGDLRAAFQYSEDSRSRSLLDSVVKRPETTEKQPGDIFFESVTRPLNLTDIQQRLPANVQALQYAVLNDKVLIWLVSRTQFTAVSRTVSQGELENMVKEYLRLVASPTSPPEETQNRAKALYELLIKPAESLLDRNKSVYIIPDKVLNSLPYATLISPVTNRFLLEDYLVETSPSASLLVILSEMAHKKDGHRDERVLSIGNPRFDREAFPTLADLPTAEREAKHVAAYYESSRLLTGADATRQAVISELPNAEVVHFALHSVADEVSPMQSKLVLAKDRAAADSSQVSDGSMQAYEIYRLRLAHTRLTVLSACNTGAERIYKGEGMISLARPFFAAGVPLVVVSLWAVDSDSTAELMVSFHKHRKQENLTTAEALRRAQLDMLNRPEERLLRTACWGAFELIGGDATY